MPEPEVPPSDDWLARISPLPLRVRCYEGENLRSYTNRLLCTNNIDLDTVQSWLRAVHDIDPPAGSAEWLTVVRRLGGLTPQCLNTPMHTSRGDWITDRRLCIQCCDGEVCRGRAPSVGKICLRHRRWLDTGTRVQTNAQLTAERKFRQLLATQEITYDSLLMARALSCSLVSTTGETYAGNDGLGSSQRRNLGRS